jgi:hypothetical protein
MKRFVNKLKSALSSRPSRARKAPPARPRLEDLEDRWAPAYLNFSAVALNPQPLPPRTYTYQWYNPADYVTLNPQPLPPRFVYMFGGW